MKIAIIVTCAIPVCILTGFGAASAAISISRLVYWMKR